MNAHHLLAAVAMTAAALAPAAAQEPGSRATREFVEASAQSDQFEILEAQTVLGQSTSGQVRAFALQMIRDHERLSATLREAAAHAGLKPPPMGISSDQALLLGALQSQQSPDLDKTYLRHQLLAHRSALTVQQAYAATGDNADVRQTAAEATTIIASHLEMAERRQKESTIP
ncbi:MULTISPECIES: DUF4142 domain-containing protein [unclassified Sphingomonas]|uniref:DUF4142 domain-containing protein n=1 Tax=unclassified Sphingomonas TaxID=196159 RepID=UPI00226A61B7|nr:MULTISPECIES: DUF4142 domain-containing protein [unclassified Sphingomonas]